MFVTSYSLNSNPIQCNINIFLGIESVSVPPEPSLVVCEVILSRQIISIIIPYREPPQHRAGRLNQEPQLVSKTRKNPQTTTGKTIASYMKDLSKMPALCLKFPAWTPDLIPNNFLAKFYPIWMVQCAFKSPQSIAILAA